MAKPARCQYAEAGRRCRRNGTGDPSLCGAHRIALADAARMTQPSGVGQMFGGGIGDALDEFVNRGRVRRGTLERAVNEAVLGVAAALGYMPGVQIPSFPSGATGPRPSMPFPFPGATRQPPQPDPREVARARAEQAARATLGFGPREPLTEEAIKVRRREFAKKHHPDAGGNVENMARVNAAADVLLEGVG